MDKKNAIRRAKRQSKVLEDNFWDCSVCTYRNTAEAFKCLMCDVRKGTSTRKPRLNQALAAQQAGAAGGAAGAAGSGAAAGGPGAGGAAGGPAGGAAAGAAKRRAGAGRGAGRRRRWPPRLRDVDRSSAQQREVTVNSVTVVITEYKRRTPAPHTSDNEDSSDTRP